MKKKFIVMFSAVMLMAVPALGLAAASAPVLSVLNGKASDGNANAHGAPVLAANGLNIYNVYRTPDNLNLKLVWSKDGGVTWGGGHNIISLPADGSNFGNTSIAISGDAVNSNQKIIHVAFQVQGPEPEYLNSIYYAWADAADLNTWSAPIRLNGSVPSLQDPNIAVTATGKIFIKSQLANDMEMYLTTSESHDSGLFTEPVVIPVSADFRNTGDDSEIFVDKSNNLHLSYPYCSNEDCSMGGIKYSRLPAGSTTWTTPTNVLAPIVNGHHHTGLVAYDANTIYIASVHDNSLTFFGSSNGGNTWTKKTIFAKSSTLASGSYVDITVNSNKAITIGAPVRTLAADGSTLKEDVKIYRSTDSGSSWSNATTIPNAHFISMTVDGNGKVAVITKGNSDGEPVNYFSKEK